MAQFHVIGQRAVGQDRTIAHPALLRPEVAGPVVLCPHDHLRDQLESHDELRVDVGEVPPEILEILLFFLVRHGTYQLFVLLMNIFPP